MQLKLALLFLSFFYVISASAQAPGPGIIGGNLLDETSAAVAGATVELISLADTLSFRKTTASGATGDFAFGALSFGYYRVRILYTGFKPIVIDSIHLREERFDFSLNDLVFRLNASTEL